jgi:hypothetical protein
MKAFTIDKDNNITVYGSLKAAKEAHGNELRAACEFTSEGGLADLVANDSKRLIAIWNSLTGVTPVKKFQTNKIAVRRIFAQLLKLEPDASAPGCPDCGGPLNADLACEECAAKTCTECGVEIPVKRGPGGRPQIDMCAACRAKLEAPAKPARVKKAKAEKAGEANGAPRETSKTAQLIEMLKRESGATLDEIMTKFGWQAHTTRAIVSVGGSLAKKFGYTVISEKVGDARTYRIA